MCFGSVPTLKSPKIDQNRPKSPNIPPSSAWNLRDNCGVYLARNIIQRAPSYYMTCSDKKAEVRAHP
jgi:hypothetical protein